MTTATIVGSSPRVSQHLLARPTSTAASLTAASAAGRPAPRVVAGVPVVLCRDDEVDAARAWANQALGHAEY